jgi:MarR family transcriptional regulator, organic hydroperoxide resistance regulator
VTREESGPMLSPGFWLHHAALAWRAELDTRLRPLNLTPTQFMLLAAAGWLEHLAGPPTQQQVADQAGADRMMTSRVIRTLGEAGLLVRQAHETDGRGLRLALTPAGRDLVQRATAIARNVDALFFGTDATAIRTALRNVAESRGTPPRR